MGSLDAIAAHFAEGARSVLVTGTAGVGKSALLVSLAAAEGAQVRSLRGVTTAADLVARLAEDLAIRAAALTDPQELARALELAASARPVFVHVLDDADELDPSACALLRQVLDAAPLHRIVVGSRIAPRIEGEHVVRVEPLGEEDAVALLVERARRTAPTYVFDEGERGALGELAKLLDGLPLALVLAAPRLPLLGARALVREVRARGVGASVLTEEIERSIASLGEANAALVERLALVGGTFDLALVERLGGDADALEEIFARSLLAVERRSNGVRYALYGAVSDVARGRGRESQLEVARVVAEHAVALADGVRAGEPDAYSDLSALALAIEHAATFALTRSDVDTAARALIALDAVPSVAERVLPLLERVERASRATAIHPHVLVVRGRAWLQIGDLARAGADMELALTEVGTDEPFVEALAATKSALVQVQSGRDATALFERAARAADRSGDQWLRAAILRDHALFAMRSGRDDDARRDLEAALATEPVGDELGALIRGALGQLHQHEGELDAAIARFSEAAAMAARVDNQSLAAWALATCGSVEIELERMDDARRHLDDAFRIATERRAPTIVAVALVMLAQLAHESGDPARATVLYQRAIPALLRVKQQRGAALALAACAAAEASLGRVRAAEGLLEDARRELTSARPGDEVALEAFALAVSAAEGPVEPARAAAIEAKARTVPSSDELRLALRRMRSAVSAPGAAPSTLAPALRIGAAGSWFETDAGRVHLPERSPLRRVLAALAAKHRDAPSATLDYAAVFAAAWPDERALAAAIANRVKVAISTLRKAGLKELLETADGGYRLVPSASIVTEPLD